MRRLSHCVQASIISVLMIAPLPASAGTVNYTFKTDIQQVQAGNVNGREYLTIQIPGKVGPYSCRGNVLALAIDERHDQNIETLAFSAMLQSDQVMITIPLSEKDCLDGKPTVLDLYLMHNS